MRTLFIISLFALMFTGASAQDEYMSAMAEGVELFNNVKTNDQLVAAANQFDLIAQVATQEWLPLYYKGLVYASLSYRTNEAEQKKKHIDMAQAAIDKAFAINNKESELYALQGMVYEALITMNPSANGQIYMSKVTGVLATASALNPKNPRAVYLQGMLILYTPEIYGGGAKAAYPVLVKAQKLFEEFVPETPYTPVWGADACKKLLASLSNAQNN
jgi:hypothetical protein